MPTVLALHAGLLLSGVAATSAIGCGARESGEAIEADPHVRVRATSLAATSEPSTSGTPGTMASTFLEPDPHDVDGQVKMVTPPPPPIKPPVTPPPAMTTHYPRMAGARPPVRPSGTISIATGAAAGSTTPPCPPPSLGATSL